MFDKIPVAVWFVLTLLIGIAGSYIRKYFLEKAYYKKSQNVTLTLLMMFSCMLYFIIASGFKIEANKTAIILGLFYGLVTVVYILAQVIAINIGPLSYTTVIISLSTVITALSGAFFYGETLNALKIIGIVLMVFCFIFAVDKSKDKDTKKSVLWFIITIFCMICCAIVGLIQKAQQESDARDLMNGFLFYSFFFATIAALIAYIIVILLEKKGILKNDPELREGKVIGNKYILLVIIYFLVSGFSYGAVNQINLKLIGVVDTAIFFPIANGGNLILVALISFVIFKEKLTLKQIVGLVLGSISCILLCI